MKCKHCGINFDDGDWGCPIGGGRAGTRGRMSEPRPASPIRWMEHMQQKPHTNHDHPARTIGQRAKATTQPIREDYSSAGRTNRQQTGSRKRHPKAAIVAVIVFLLVNLLPLLFTMVGDIIDGVGSAIPDFGDLAENWAEDSGYSDYYEPNDEPFLDEFIDGAQIADLADGTLALIPQGNDDYTLRWDSAADTSFYSEDGYAWCMQSDDDTVYRPEDFPPEEYDQYYIVLTADATEYTGSIPDWCMDRATGENTDSLWLIAYIDRETEQITLEDMDMLGLFDGSDLAEVYHYDSM